MTEYDCNIATTEPGKDFKKGATQGEQADKQTERRMSEQTTG